REPLPTGVSVYLVCLSSILLVLTYGHRTSDETSPPDRAYHFLRFTNRLITAVRRKELFCQPGFVHPRWRGQYLMVKSEKKTRDLDWLRLSGYRVVSLKAELDDHTFELERAIQEGVLVYPDLARPDFYDVLLEDGWAYIHVYRETHAVYLLAHSTVG